MIQLNSYVATTNKTTRDNVCKLLSGDMVLLAFEAYPNDQFIDCIVDAVCLDELNIAYRYDYNTQDNDVSFSIPNVSIPTYDYPLFYTKPNEQSLYVQSHLGINTIGTKPLSKEHAERWKWLNTRLPLTKDNMKLIVEWLILKII